MRPSRLDLLLAGGLAIGSVFSLIEDSAPAIAFVAQPLAALSLAWRRINPFVPAVATLTATLGILALSGQGPGDVLYLAIWIVGSYASGAYLPLRRSLASLALWWITLVVSALNGPGWGDVLFMGILTLGAWAPGVAARRSEQARREAAELAVRREAEARDAVASERARIARELHDVVAHAVGVMLVHAGAAQAVLDADPQRARAALDTVQDAGQEAITELRRMLGLLRDAEPSTAPLPRLADLDALVERMRAAGLTVDIDRHGDLDLVPAQELTVYRIVQEALTNALKHAPGSAVRVVFRRTSERLEVDIANSAPPAPVSPAAGTGSGLLGLRERVAVFGGELTTGAGPDGGFRVTASLPLREQASAVAGRSA